MTSVSLFFKTNVITSETFILTEFILTELMYTSIKVLFNNFGILEMGLDMTVDDLGLTVYKHEDKLIFKVDYQLGDDDNLTFTASYLDGLKTSFNESYITSLNICLSTESITIMAVELTQSDLAIQVCISGNMQFYGQGITYNGITNIR